MANKPRIVIVGAGYAGLMTARTLLKKMKHEQAEITLINKQDYHYEATWLHEVAAGTIAPEKAQFLLSDVLNTKKVNILVDEVIKIEKESQTVHLKSNTLAYDYLVIALGFKTNTFGIKGVEDYSFFIQDIDSSKEISHHIEEKFKKYSTDATKDEKDLTVLVGGGGFTGIEFVGELTNHLPKLAKQYGIDPTLVKIIALDGGSILGNFRNEPDLVDYARNVLSSRHVELREGVMMKEFTEDGILVGEDRELIQAGTIVWTAGVKANPILEEIGLTLERGKAVVGSDLRAKEEDRIFVLGDCAYGTDENGQMYPPTAQLAMQHGQSCGGNLVKLLEQKPLKPFVYNHKGTVASIGHNSGVGSIFKGIQIKGKFAAFMKKVVDNRSLYLLGGLKLLLKKGKF